MAKPLALTSGEPAGIGPDIAIEAWLRRDELKLPPFYLLGDIDLFRDRARTLGESVEQTRAGYLQKISLRRMVDAQDVANLVVFLASDMARNISGQAISVDGNTEYL